MYFVSQNKFGSYYQIYYSDKLNIASIDELILESRMRIQ